MAPEERGGARQGAPFRAWLLSLGANLTQNGSEVSKEVRDIRPPILEGAGHGGYCDTAGVGWGMGRGRWGVGRGRTYKQFNQITDNPKLIGQCHIYIYIYIYLVLAL